MITPWGKSQGKEILAPGITYYSTARHGGYYVSKAIRAVMEKKYVNDDGWYEEDAEWSKIALAFPHLFTPQIVSLAIDTYNAWCKPKGEMHEPC